MQDEEMKIDVGETDEQEQEIDLDAAPQEEQPEEKPEVEVTDKPAEPVKAEEATEQTSEMENYSKGVKARIASLTKKMREAERQREEAITFAKGQQAEVERMKKKYSSLDETYTNEFEKRVTTNVEAAKAKLAQAIATGNIDDQVAAQTEIATLAMEANRLGKLKELQEEKTVEQPAQPAQPKVAPPPVVPPPDPKADAWAQKNTWFGVDNAMTYTAFDIHKKLVEEEGFDPASDEYYTEVDKRIRLEFPHKFANNSDTTP